MIIRKTIRRIFPRRLELRNWGVSTPGHLRLTMSQDGGSGRCRVVVRIRPPIEKDEEVGSREGEVSHEILETCGATHADP
jgi:hypothetical protein